MHGRRRHAGEREDRDRAVDEGTLTLDNTAVIPESVVTAVNADDVVTKAQIDGDLLTFTPARKMRTATPIRPSPSR